MASGRRWRGSVVPVLSPDDAVVKLGDSAAGASFIEQLKVETGVGGKGSLATSQHDRPEEQVALVHQTRLERLGREIGSAHSSGRGLRRPISSAEWPRR